MPNTPLNPDALEAAAIAFYLSVRGTSRRAEDWETVRGVYKQGYRNDAEAAVSAYLATAQPVVNRVESLPAKMRMLAWEGGEFEVGEIPEGHVLVGFEMTTDRAWSMADKVTIHIERKDTTNGR